MTAPADTASSDEPASASPKAKRRRQVDRSADTQRRLIEATVTCLNAGGYAGTSTEAVLKQAGVSRGALLHHFPTRADLMVAVVRAVYDEEVGLYADRLDRIRDPVERFFSIPEATWFVLSRPAGLAAFEIFNAARSEPGLPERLAPVQARIEAEALALVRIHRRAAGLQEAKEAVGLQRTITAAVRGLSVDPTLNRNPREAMKAIELLKRLMRSCYADQLTS